MKIKQRNDSLSSKGSFSRRPKKSRTQTRDGMKNIVENIININSSLEK
jgi:hypothetical protein